MSLLWGIWILYVAAFIADWLYIQPYRRRCALQSGSLHRPGAISFGLRAALPVFTLVLVLRTFVIDVLHVPTPSMEPTLKEGSRILVNRLSYGVRSPLTGKRLFGGRDPRRGDIAVFRYPREPTTLYVKRIVGVPGDHIRVHGDRIMVNGSLLFSPSVSPDPDGIHVVDLGDVRYTLVDDASLESSADVELAVPESHFFALGDNLDHSQDSRTWGLLASRHLIGLVTPPSE